MLMVISVEENIYMSKYVIEYKNGDSKTFSTLQGADLIDADLRGADLQGANLQGANLTDADLIDADLRYANLRDADLRYANLRGADFEGANLRGADFESANLRDADLRYADLRDAVFKFCIANNKEIFTIGFGKYTINIIPSTKVMSIGCEQHSIDDWYRFSDDVINSMDKGALEWWLDNRDLLKLHISHIKGVTNVI